MIINSLNVRKGASWRIMFKTIPQTSMEQQQSEQQVFDLEDCQEHEKQNKIINVQRMALWGEEKCMFLLFINHRVAA